jgi:uncharacterized membrane protein
LLAFVALLLAAIALWRLERLARRLQTTERRLTELDGRAIAAISLRLERIEALLDRPPAERTAAPPPATALPVRTPDTSVPPRRAPLPSPVAVRPSSLPIRPAAIKATAPAPERNLEVEIGSRWMLVVGTLVLVLGVGFFVKYAFDHQWITETARVVLGTLAGVVTSVAGLRLARRGYTTYGQLVTGGGLAMLYLAAYAATSLYGLVPDLVGLVWMAAVAGTTALVGDRQRSLGLALIAVVLAYQAPLLVGSHQDRHITLFLYDATLAVATYLLVRRHHWPILGPVAFLFTWNTFSMWAERSYRPELFVSTELYLTFVSGVFAAVAWEYWKARRLAYARYAAYLLASSPVLYHFASLGVLFDHSVWLLVYLIASTAVGVAVARNHPWVRLAIWAGGTLPLMVWANAHTAGAWYMATLATAGGLYLLHLAGQLRALPDAPTPAWPEIALFHANGLGVFGAMYIAVWANAGSTPALAAGFAAWHLLLSWSAGVRVPSALPHALALAFTFTATTIALALTGPWMTAAWAAEGAGVVFVGLILRRSALRYGGTVLLAASVVHLVTLQFGQTAADFVPLLNSRTAAGAFIASLLFVLAGLHERRAAPSDRPGVREWIIAANVLTVGLLTADIRSFWELSADRLTASFARELSLSLAWGAYGMALMALGFRRRSSTLRYFALALFAATVLKMFAVDLLTLDGGYRIAGFLILGLVLLLASFLYQRRRSPDATESMAAAK